ncbi:MAG: DUF4199 domain-containing protein [Saprospiraceae bacterium]|nr:DUF4199 domain-containing protein [Saprospiraceae bacterium]
MLNNTGVKNGLFLGLASTVYSHVSYMINPKMLLTGVAYLAFIITIYFMYRAAAQERKLNEGILSFGEALKVTFLTYTIGGLIGAIYIYLMFNVIDPSLNDVMREVSVEQAESVAKFLGAEDQLDSLPDEMEKQNIQMSFSMVFLNYLVSLIFPGFIFALVISAITKKENT